jgi:TPR repeat protein
MVLRASALLYDDPADVEGARALLERARAAGELSALPQLGVLAEADGDSALAIALWEEAANGGVPEGMTKLGIHLTENGDTDAGISWLERGVAGGDRQATYPLATAVGLRGEKARARELIASMQVDDVIAPYIGGSIAQEYGDEDYALELFLQSASGGYPGAMKEAGHILQQRGDLDAAITQYQRAIDAGDLSGHYSIGVAYEHAGDRERAWQQYEQGAALDDLLCTRALGVMRTFANDDEGAKPYYEKAVELGDEYAVYQLATTLIRLGSLDEAQSLAERLIDNGNFEGLGILGNIHEDRGDTARANELYREAGEKGVAIGALNYANGLRSVGDDEAAREWYERAAALGLPDAMNALGVYAEEADDVDAALDWYARAAEHGMALAAQNLAKLQGQISAEGSEPLDFTGPPLGAAGITLEELDANVVTDLVREDLVRVHLEVAYPGGGEYVWCEVESVDGDEIVGRVTNLLAHEPLQGIAFHQPLRFRRTHVLERRDPAIDDPSDDAPLDNQESLQLMNAAGESVGTFGEFRQRFEAGAPIPPEALRAVAGLHHRGAAIAAALVEVGTDDDAAFRRYVEIAAGTGDSDAFALREALTAPDADQSSPTQICIAWLGEHPNAFADERAWLHRAAEADMEGYACATGALLCKLGEPQAAERLLEPAVRAEVPGCKWELARARAVQDDHAGALTLQYEMVAEGFDRALVLCTFSLIQLDRRDEAAATIREAIQRGVEDADDLGFRLGLITVDESDPADLLRFGTLNYRYNEEEEALRLLHAGAAMDDAECEFFLALICDQEGRPQEALGHASRSFELGRIATWAWMMITALDARDDDRAVEWMQRGLQAGDEEAGLALAEHRGEHDQPQEAIALLDILLASDDEAIVRGALIQRIVLHVQADEDSEALDAAERLAALRDERGYTWAAMLTIDDDEATGLRHFAYAASLGGTVAMRHLSERESAAGNASEALLWLERAIAAGDAEAARMRWMQAWEADDPTLMQHLSRAVALEEPFSMLSLAFLTFDDDPDGARALVARARDTGYPIAEFLQTADNKDELKKMRRMGIE